MTKEEEYNIVKEWVKKDAKTFYIDNNKSWSTNLTCYIDLQDFGETPEDSLNKIIKRIQNWEQAREYILNKHKAQSS